MTGGWVSGGMTDTTESLVEGSSTWSTHGSSWSGIAETRILTHNNIPYMFGGNIGSPLSGTPDDLTTSLDILSWNDATKKWSKTGLMKEARANHGVSSIVINWDTLNACQP